MTQKSQTDGEWLKEARKKLGYTQQQLGDEIEMTRVMIGLMERDDKPVEKRTKLAVKYLLTSKKPGENAIRPCK